MSINKYSNVDEISNFLKQILQNDDIVQKFKNEKIKGNEIFYLTDNDYDNVFNIRLKKRKLKSILNEIEKNNTNIKDYEEKIYINSNEEQVYNFLKKELFLEDKIMEKFKDINGKKLNSLKENDLIELGLKIGERRKILNYISSMEFKSNENNANNISKNSTTGEICSFLKNKFNVSEEILEDFRSNNINGNYFFELNQNTIREFNLTEVEKKEILDYIQNYNNRSEEEEDEIIDKEEEFNYFHLINIIEYLTSQDDYNKCPFNKKEGFIQLCNFMGIENKDNCSEINFDQANKMNLKISTLWGSKDALFEFFENKKMKNVLEYFKETKNDSEGIYLLIKDDKSFAYNLIWPGKMSYLYKKLDEPQKDLLLSLVRIGFSLSNDNIICLSEKQKNEFDFTKIKTLQNKDIFKASEGELASQNVENYFKFGEDLKISYDLQKEGKIQKFKLNNSSIFFYFSLNESLNYEVYDKVKSNELNYKVESIILDNNFELNGSDLYNFIKEFDCLKNLGQKQKYLEIIKLYKTKIDEIKKLYEDILSKYIEKIQNFKYQCEFCNNNNKEIYAYHCDDHGLHLAHQNCISSKENIENNKFNLLNSLIKKNDAKCEIIKSCILIFLHYLSINKNNNLLLNNIIIDYISKLKEKSIVGQYLNSYTKNLNNLMDNIKNYFEREEIKILEADEEIKSLLLQWKKDLIKEINEFHNSKYKDLNIWHEYINAYYDNNEKKYYYTFKKYRKNASNIIIKLYNIFESNIEGNYLLKNKEEKKWDKNNYAYEFENYYKTEKNGILIRNIGKDLYEVNLRGKEIKFDGCYDYYNNILILSKKNQSREGIFVNIYFLDGDNKIKSNKGKALNYINNLFKIKIVPYKFGYSIYFLIFSSNLISLIDDNFIYITDIKLNEIYKEYDLNLFQFLVYEKFLLIFSFDKEKQFWDLDIFEIENKKIIKKEKVEKFFNPKPKEGKFSICNVKNIPILYFCYLENNNFQIKLTKILTSLSHLINESNSNNSRELKLTEGNCVINYFYHLFLKYPSLGALQYNYYHNENLKKQIYLYSKDLKQTGKFKNYINELKELCIKERQFNSIDIDYEFQGLFRRDKIKNYINLDALILKYIQAIPLQIAKIKNHYFKSMSNGKDIKIDELFEKYSHSKDDIDVKIKTDYYANNINFGMKNSIFNFYDLPVVVLAFMGAQSIGKSTLSNELVESFFNVSGMRCTEGIWMAVTMFNGVQNTKKCTDKCKCCGEKCRLFIHCPEIDCICEDCCCNENCCLLLGEANIKENQYFCYKRCALPFGHKNICTIHSDPDNKKCEKHNEKKCNCIIEVDKEKGKHICEISPYNHGFICVSLDFEGLGTFERSLEQDIDLAMVGAALANSLILRADKTFDAFMQSRMMDWSEASKKIKKTKNFNENIHFFGGNIIFCQKDIPQANYEEVKKEFENKMKEVIGLWKENEKERNKNDNNKIFNEKQIFGIFSKYINSPTPIFNKIEFYNTLRKELIHLIIKNILMNRSRPYYRTGTEFMSFLKKILAIVEIHDYNALDNVAIDNLQKYLVYNKIKAIEIFGIYPNLEDKVFNNINDLEDYLNSNLEHLKASLIYKSKLLINEEICMNLESSDLKVGKFENINYKKFKININISENINSLGIEKKVNAYKLKIQGIKEFGLLLLIPSKYKETFGIENIRENLFSLWKIICKNINLSNFEIIKYFRIFISELIKRRKNNIINWLNNLTSSFTEIDVNSLKQFDFSLEEKWNICNEKCYYCHYQCVKILGHSKEHNCGLDHICHEKCQICDIIKCDIKDCKCNCQYKKNNEFKEMQAGHESLDIQKGIIHSCSHHHKCQKNEQCYLNNLEGCSKECKLEYGHEGKCFCNSKHFCDKKCIYKEYSK